MIGKFGGLRALTPALTASRLEEARTFSEQVCVKNVPPLITAMSHEDFEGVREAEPMGR